MEQMSSRTDVAAATHLNGARAASTIVLLAGIWFFVSPWVYGGYTHANSWNSWIVGAVLFILGCIRVARPAYSSALSWCNMILGIWAFFSPWIYGYTGNRKIYKQPVRWRDCIRSLHYQRQIDGEESGASGLTRVAQSFERSA